MNTTTRTAPSPVTAVTVYGVGTARSLSVADALALAQMTNVTLMLGAMRPDYLGREVVEMDDLARWMHEDDEAAEWAAITAGEKYAAENGLLR